MDKKYLLISEPTGMTAEALGDLVGMRAVDTPLGTMLEQPKPFVLYKAMAEINRALNPPPKRDPRCTCGRYQIINMCPVHPVV